MPNKHAQTAIEFFVLIGAVFFFFTLFLGSIQLSKLDKMKEQRELAVKEIAVTIQDEVRFASESSDGYQRKFHLPEKVQNTFPYSIQIIQNKSVYLKTDDGLSAILLPISNVTGNLSAGYNIIKKINNTVFVNSTKA